MSNLQKFNDTLEEFDKEVSKLKSASETYKKLEALVEAYDEIKRGFDKNGHILEKSIELLKMQQDKLSSTLAELKSLNKQNKDDLSKLFEEKTDQIRKENKEFYKEFESTVKIKLDDNKSQIKQLIENERSQIKQIFEIEFAKNTKELKQTFETEIYEQTKPIKILLWIFGSLTLLANAFILYKYYCCVNI
ncbi:MAG: hypothetical protein LBO74_14555 [Candidatus Symbiothrix sp.]|jgi:ABC-type transporter Mla subunit MlaD|nr:hypothetical protein [Candidatus Symbiothrix sp.]